jgi:hypothetical protein
MDDCLAGERALPYYQPWDDVIERYFCDAVAVSADGTVTPKASASAVEQDLDLHFTVSMCLHFPALRCPVLFVRPQLGLAGERGHVFSEAEADNIVRHIPRAQRFDAPGVNHYTLLLRTHSPIVARVANFLSQT